MKKSAFILLSLLLFTSLSLAQLNIPGESQAAEVKQQIAFTDITISYTRPNKKGREIFGEMVPYGTVWRTGANSNTKLSTSKDIFLNGHRIPKGKYAIYSIPEKDEWTFILNNDTTLWGHYGYDESNDFLRFKVKPRKSKVHMETMSFSFLDVNEKQARLELSWGNLVIPLEIKIDEEALDREIMASIDKTLKLPEDRDEPIVVAHDYFHAAVYYMDHDRDSKQALIWFDKAIGISNVSYFNLYKSELLGKLGRYDEAIEASKKGLAIFMVKRTNKEWIWRHEQQIKMWESKRKRG